MYVTHISGLSSVLRAAQQVLSAGSLASSVFVNYCHHLQRFMSRISWIFLVVSSLSSPWSCAFRLIDKLRATSHWQHEVNEEREHVECRTKRFQPFKRWRGQSFPCSHNAIIVISSLVDRLVTSCDKFHRVVCWWKVKRHTTHRLACAAALPAVPFNFLVFMLGKVNWTIRRGR